MSSRLEGNKLHMYVGHLFIPAAAQKGRSGLSCMGCPLGCGQSVASDLGRCRTTFVSTLMSLPRTVEEGARVRAMENGEVGATQEDQNGASAWLGEALEKKGARAWRQGSEEQTEGPGRTLAAAAERMAASLGVSEGEGWLKPT